MDQHRSHNFWAQLVAEYERVAATQTLREFARCRGVSAKTLANWRSKLRRESESQPTLVPMIVRSTMRDHDAVVIVRLGVEPTIEVMDLERASASWIAELIHRVSKVSG